MYILFSMLVLLLANHSHHFCFCSGLLSTLPYVTEPLSHGGSLQILKQSPVNSEIAWNKYEHSLNAQQQLTSKYIKTTTHHLHEEQTRLLPSNYQPYHGIWWHRYWFRHQAIRWSYSTWQWIPAYLMTQIVIPASGNQMRLQHRTVISVIMTVKPRKWCVVSGEGMMGCLVFHLECIYF